MTSTNLAFGNSVDPRSSSRIIKPPGGGHTDIFGIYDQPKAVPVKANAPKSAMQEVFAMDNTDNKTDNKEQAEQIDENGAKENGEKANGDQHVEKQNGEKQNGNEPPKPVPVTPQRVRVPPGGFSSGLW